MNEVKTKKIQGAEQTEYFTNCFTSDYQIDGRSIAVNDKYLAISWEKAGLIKLANTYEPQNLYNNKTGFKFEDSNILDMEFSPFKNNILCYSNENNNIYMTKLIEDGKNAINIKASIYKGHEKKINSLNFNPIASNLMCSCTYNGDIHVWDSKKFETHIDFNINDNPNSIIWNPNGDLLGITTRNGFLNIYDARSADPIYNSKISEKFTYSKFSWIDNKSVATIGWNKKSEKFLELLDIRKNNGQNLESVYIDNNTFITMPFVNPELKIIYSIAKEEYDIKIYDYSSGKPIKSNEYKASETNNFSIYFNRNYLNKGKSEIDRFARLTKKKILNMLNFIYLQKKISKEYYILLNNLKALK